MEQITNTREANSPTAIEYMGEHIEEYVLDDLCWKVNDWLRERTNPSEIEKIIEEEMDGPEGPKLIVRENEESEEEYLIDSVEYLAELEHFYREAFNGESTRALWINDNSYGHIMAIKGSPDIEGIVGHYDVNGDMHGIPLEREEPWHDDLKKEGVTIKSIYFALNATKVATDTHNYDHRVSPNGIWTVEKTPISE